MSHIVLQDQIFNDAFKKKMAYNTVSFIFFKTEECKHILYDLVETMNGNYIFYRSVISNLENDTCTSIYVKIQHNYYIIV